MNKIRKHSIIRSTCIMTSAVVALCCCTVLYVRKVDESLRQDTKNVLAQVAGQNAVFVRRQIENDLMMLRTVALFIGEQPTFDMMNSRRILEQAAAQSPFKRMGIITPDGSAYTSDNAHLELGKREYFQSAMKGESLISAELEDQTDGQKIYVYATPVYRNQEIAAVLFATSAADTFQEMITMDLFEGEGYSYLADENGKILLHPVNQQSVSGMLNIFDQLSGDESENTAELKAAELDQMRQSILMGKSGIEEYMRDGTRRYLCYNPIGVNGWYILSVVSEHVAAEKAVYLNSLTLLASAAAAMVFIFLFSYVLILQNRNKRQLQHLAYTDPVTDGGNWNRFLSDAHQVLEESPSENYVMVSFDIDKFKVFNDLFGHTEGNRILKYIWNTLEKNLHPTERFARVSADNYVILMQNEPDEEIIRRLEKIQLLVNQRAGDTAPRYLLTLSFGIYRILAGEQDISAMNDRASIARKSNKAGEHKIKFFDDSERERGLLEKELENEMVSALENGEFVVYLQPKYSASSNKIVGAEALVRWNRPGKGMLPPDSFIPLFEHNGFITEIDGFVLDQTCSKLQEWKEAGLPPIPVSVNVSRRNLNTLDFGQTILDTVARHEIPNQLIELELTETGVIDFKNIDKLIEIMESLKKDGFVLSMDDFGSGYSSLNLLRRLPFDVLKLDRAFFGQDSELKRGRTMIADVAEMARHLDMTVVAEGVETKEQVDFLTSIGCDIVQGYYFARPMAISEFEALRSREG